MRHMLQIAAEVPAEQFRARKYTFLELFQVPGTPIFLKICRELGGDVGNMAGQVVALGEAAGHLPKSKWPASQKRWPAGHLPKSGGNFVFSPHFLYILSSIQSETTPTAAKSSPLASQTIFSFRSALYTRFSASHASCFRKNIRF